MVRNVSTTHRRDALALVLVASSWFFLTQTAVGQTTADLAGVVRAADGAPVAGAEVRVLELRRSTRSDAEGAFRFAALPPGTYLVEASREGRGHGVERVTIGEAAAAVEIVLLPEVHAEEIVVTAGADLHRRLELAQPTTVLDGERLAAAVRPSLGETLAGEAGVASTSFGPGASRPVIRGLSGDRIRTLEDGVGSLDVSALSPDHAVSVEPLQAERIEVVRGPATLLYGSSAIGGVVNVLDGRIPDFPASAAIAGDVTLVGGTVADERTGSLDLTGGGERWVWALGALRRDTDDFEIPGAAEVAGLDEHAEEGEEHAEEGDFGVLSNSDIETSSGRVGLSRFFGDNGFFGVSLSGFDTDYGIPGGHEHAEEEHTEGEGAEEEHAEEGGIRIDMEQRRADLRGEVTRPFGAFRGFRARLGLADYEHAEVEPTGELGTLFENDAWESRFELVQKPHAAWSGSFGLQLGQRDLQATGEEAFIPPTETGNLGLFTFQELERGSVAYQFGARFERQEVDTPRPDLPDRSFDGVSASFGIVITPAESWSFGGNLSRAVKAPAAEELLSDGAHLATQTFEIGDPNLDEETGLGVDLFVRRSVGRLTGEFHVFRTEFSDFIFPALTGEEEDGLPVVLYSQADAEFTGAELDATVELVEGEAGHLDLELLADFVRGELAGGGGDLPRIPARRAGLGLRYHGARWTAGAEVQEVADQDRLAANETPTEGYTLLGADLGYRFFFTGSVVDLLLRGRNLIDEEARNHVSFLKDLVPLPGRDVSLVARFAF